MPRWPCSAARPGVPLAFWPARAHCWLMVNMWSTIGQQLATRTSKSSTELLLSSSLKCTPESHRPFGQPGHVDSSWSTFGQPLLNHWSTFGQLLVNYWSTTGQSLVNHWSTIGQPGPCWPPWPPAQALLTPGWAHLRQMAYMRFTVEMRKGSFLERVRLLLSVPNPRRW